MWRFPLLLIRFERFNLARRVPRMQRRVLLPNWLIGRWICAAHVALCHPSLRILEHSDWTLPARLQT
jgi:hypothetical protein